MSSDVATRAFVKAEIETLRAETNVGFDIVHQKIGRLEADVGEIKVAVRQIDIRARNGKLKNPTARIYPIPIFVQGRGSEPDPAKFPKYADQFYSLRNPQNERDHQMLAYLSKFYQIWFDAADASQSSEEEEVQVDPERAVELLEGILGLEEDNFIAFRARAQQLANQGSSAAEKRDRPTTRSSGGPEPQRRKLQTPSDAAPTVPFTNTPSRAPGRPASDGSPTVPFTETPSRAAPERPSNLHTVAARPRRPSTTIPDSEETASS